MDLCDLLGVERPMAVDRHGTEYTFEKSVLKLGGTAGYADVWKKGCFAWEYKGPKKNLVQAYAQLKQYADALENPPILIVSDMHEIRIHTNFTNAPTQQHVIYLADLNAPETRQLLQWCFKSPERLRPNATRETVTAAAATALAGIAVGLRGRGLEPGRVAHFLNKLIFCLFSEDIDLLPNRTFAGIIEESIKSESDFVPMTNELFEAMRSGNRRFGATSIPWFNGGLFNDDDVVDLGYHGIQSLQQAARLDWSYIDPSIFGTLFEAGLDDEKRQEMASLFDPTTPIQQPVLFGILHPDKGPGVGIHYTDPQTIRKLIEPVILRPLRLEWSAIRQASQGMGPKQVLSEYFGFRERLENFRILDPACGSGNFLAIALSLLKDFDLNVSRDAVALGLPPDRQRVNQNAVLGLEVNPYAAELARLAVWITELQWQLRNGFPIDRSPILGNLSGIVCRDALLDDGKPTVWPDADVVIGNPPFVGSKLVRTKLGDKYIDRLFSVYEGAVPAEADLVAYWFAKAWDGIRSGKFRRAGLVATNSIRGGASRRVLDRITTEGVIFDAWDDEPWVLEGAAVRVSLICFSASTPNNTVQLDGRSVQRINADLTAAMDLTAARPLAENSGVAFSGISKKGKFEIPGNLARAWLALPANPNGRKNADVLSPWWNGDDFTGSRRDYWIINFGEMTRAEAALYERPFSHIEQTVYPVRSKSRSTLERTNWWKLARRAPAMFTAIEPLTRFLVTPETAKHRVFAWCPKGVVPDKNLVVIAKDDDTTFGILQSRFHSAWALRLGTSLEDRPRYTSSTTFRTYPFPAGLTPDLPVEDVAKNKLALAIASAAQQLNVLRDRWLWPDELVKRVPEDFIGFPERIVARGPKEEAEMKKRTITNLYNLRPTWLNDAHEALDSAVAAAYGWSSTITEDESLSRLLEMNLSRPAVSQAAAN